MFEQLQSKELFEVAKKFAYEYIDTVDNRGIYPTRSSIEDLRRFDEPLPERTGDANEIVTMLGIYGSPATVAQNGKRYLGFVNGAANPVSLATKWLTDVWDQNAALYVMSPVTACLEEVCQKWLIKLFDVTDECIAGFVTGTSVATLCALVTARNSLLKKVGWDVAAKGLFSAPRLRVVAGEKAHASVFKALTFSGFGSDDVTLVETDQQGRIIPEKMPPLDPQTILILQAGNVNTGSFDFIEELCSIAGKAGAWVHIDGAFGLWARCSTKKRYLVSGMEQADSWSVDTHKTLNAPYECGILLCKDRNGFIDAMKATGPYIHYHEMRDGMMFTPEMSRRARAVELWATLKYYGRSGIEQLVDGLCAMAVAIAEGLKENGFRILNDVVFNQVLVAGDNDQVTENILSQVQKSNRCWCGGSIWNGERVIRISVCSWKTDDTDVANIVDEFKIARMRSERDDNDTCGDYGA